MTTQAKCAAPEKPKEDMLRQRVAVQVTTMVVIATWTREYRGKYYEKFEIDDRTEDGVIRTVSSTAAEGREKRSNRRWVE
jgi:hypothetical protein